MEAPFLEGIHYFSREEEALSKERHDDRLIFTDIDIDPNDLETLNFVKKVTEEIENWIATRGVSHDHPYYGHFRFEYHS